MTLKSGSTMTLYGAPDGADAASLAKAAADPVVSTSVDHSVDGDTVKTTLNYVTANGGDTVIVPMADQAVDGGSKATGTYASIYGAMDLYTGSLADHHRAGRRAVRRARPVEPVRRGQGGTGRADQDRRRVDRLRRVRHRHLLRRQDALPRRQPDDAGRAAGRHRRGRRRCAPALTAELTKWFDPKGCATSATKCFVYDDTASSR